MPAYKFEALDAAGKSATGLLDADNARDARAQLRAQILRVTSEFLQSGSGTTQQQAIDDFLLREGQCP